VVDEDVDEGLDEDDMHEVLVHLGAARSLQRLTLTFGDDVDWLGVPLKLFGHLTGLQQLRELHVSAAALPEPDQSAALDALHITKLTQLTRLSIESWDVGSVVAVALACNLTQLRWLKLVECELMDAAALPSIGKLAQLQHLDLKISSKLRHTVETCDDCLLFLTELRALTHLQLSEAWGAAPSKEALDTFWSLVRGQPHE
jgi:hypothetical protein